MNRKQRGRWVVGFLLFLLAGTLTQDAVAEVSLGEVITKADRVMLGASVRTRYER